MKDQAIATRLCSGILLLSMIIELCGCSSGSGRSSSEDISNEIGQTDSVSTDPVILSSHISYGLKTVADYSVADGAGTDDGYYSVLSIPDEKYGADSEMEHAGLITYVDYSTGTNRVLCSDPDCKHNDESCTAYIKYVKEAYVFSTSDENNLIIISAGRRFSEEPSCVIYIADADGSDRKELAQLKNTECVDIGEVICCDNNSIFFIVFDVEKTLEDDDDSASHHLKKVDLSTGSCSDEMTFSSQPTLLGTYGDRILIAEYMRSVMTYYVTAYDPYTGASDVIFKQNKSFTDLYSYKFYSGMNGNDSSFEFKNYVTGTGGKIEGIKRSTVNSDCWFEYHDPDLNRWIFAYAEDKDGPVHAIHIDGDSGTVKESSLLNGKIFTSPAGNIVGDFYVMTKANDRYLVKIGEKETSIGLYDNSGSPYTYTTMIPEYALISCDDYWSDNPVYTSISNNF